jgi:predicted dehydrogenase
VQNEYRNGTLLNKLRAGIIGCGQIAGGYNSVCEIGKSLTHACSYKNLDGVELVASSDPDISKRKSFGKKWQVDNVYESHEEMISKENLDIVSICSPAEFHIDAFRTISKFDSVKGIFCEKPVSYDLNESIKILDLSRDKVVSVNFFRRWNSSIKKLRNEIKNNKYGEINYLNIRYSKGILTNGSHLIDLILWIFGDPIDLMQFQIHDNSKIDPGADFKLLFKNGLSAIFSHIPNIQYTFIEIDIHTEKGLLAIHQRGQKITWSPIINEPFFNGIEIVEPQEIIETDWLDCPSRAINELIEVMNNGGRVSCSVEDGMKVTEICDYIINYNKS